MTLTPAQRAAVTLAGRDVCVVVNDFTDERDLKEQCDRLIQLLEKPVAAASGTVSLDARLGLAKAPEDATDPQSLYRKADIALQQARSEQAEALGSTSASARGATIVGPSITASPGRVNFNLMQLRFR